MFLTFLAFTYPKAEFTFGTGNSRKIPKGIQKLRQFKKKTMKSRKVPETASGTGKIFKSQKKLQMRKIIYDGFRNLLRKSGKSQKIPTDPEILDAKNPENSQKNTESSEKLRNSKKKILNNPKKF